MPCLWASRFSATYAVLAFGTAAVGLVGYSGFVLYPSLDLPAGTGAGLLLLAAGAGVASFFSPCSFPLLVSILARPIAIEAQGEGGRPIRKALGFAAALSLGAATFLALLGVAIAFGGGALFEDVTFTSTTGRVLRIVVGALLILLGLIQLNRLPISFRRFEPAMHGFLGRQAKLRRGRPLAGFAIFGFGYLLAGFG